MDFSKLPQYSRIPCGKTGSVTSSGVSCSGHVLQLCNKKFEKALDEMLVEADHPAAAQDHEKTRTREAIENLQLIFGNE